MAPVWDGPKPIRIHMHQLERQAEEARLSKIADRLSEMAAECSQLDKVAEAQLRERAAHTAV